MPQHCFISCFYSALQRLTLVSGALLVSSVMNVKAAPQDQSTPLAKVQWRANTESFHHLTEKQLNLLSDGIIADTLEPTAKNVVGWEFTGHLVLDADMGHQIDLGSITIHGVVNPFSGAYLADRMIALVSTNGREYRNIGTLTPTGRQTFNKAVYTSVEYQLADIAVPARYLKLIVIPRGLAFFASEIQLTAATAPAEEKGSVVADVEQFVLQLATEVQAHRRIKNDFELAKRVVIGALSQKEIDAETRKTFRRKIDALEARVNEAALDLSDPLRFRAILPFNPLHAEVYQLYGSLAEISEAGSLKISTPNRWDQFSPAIQSGSSTVLRSLDLVALAGERRSDAFLLENRSASVAAVTLRLQGEAADFSKNVTLYKTETTDTKKGVLVQSALTPLRGNQNGEWQTEVAAGMNQMIWVSYEPTATTKPAKQTGKLSISSTLGSHELALTLTQLNGEMPLHKTLHVGGWDYLQEALTAPLAIGLKGAKSDLAAEIRDFLKKGYTDTAWAVSILDLGQYDEDGVMTTPPSVTAFDEWIAFWPDARRYAIFSPSSDRIGGLKLGTPAFSRAVASWAKFWSDHFESKGITQEVILLLIDEPGLHKGQESIAIAWANAVKAAKPRFKLWSNAVYADPTKAEPKLWEPLDVLSPLRTQWVEGLPGFIPFYEARKKEGKGLEFYSCDGPAFELDPYSYYKLQAWSAFDADAAASQYWMFSNIRSIGLSWNEYINQYIDYVPFFIGKDGVQTARQWEALKEGIQDFEYFTLLKQLREKAANHPELKEETAAADELLGSVEKVLHAADANKLRWEVTKDRSLADDTIRRTGALIDRLNTKLEPLQDAKN